MPGDGGLGGLGDDCQPAEANGKKGDVGAPGTDGTASGNDLFGSAVLAAKYTVLTKSLTAGTTGKAYKATLTEKGGSGKASWAAYGLPPGLTASTAGVISGKPQLTGTFTVIVTVSRAGGWGYAMLKLKIT